MTEWQKQTDNYDYDDTERCYRVELLLVNSSRKTTAVKVD